VAEVSTIGLDIAKHVFQAHGADASGPAVFRKKITRAKLIEFLASHGCGQRAQRGARRLVAEVELALAAIPPFADQPGFLAWQVFTFSHGWAVGDPHAHGREAGREHALGALAPRDAAPRTIGQSRGRILARLARHRLLARPAFGQTGLASAE